MASAKPDYRPFPQNMGTMYTRIKFLWPCLGLLLLLFGACAVDPNIGGNAQAATLTRYSGPWPHSTDFQASEGWTGNVPASADAASIDITWARVHPTKTTWDWSVYDTELATLHNQGKKAVLILWDAQKGSGSSISSQATPAYVFQDLGASNYVYDSAGGSLIPDYWNAVYVADWQAYIQGVAQHFAVSPYVGDIVYERGPTGKGGETTPCLGAGFSADATCKSKASAWGPTHNPNADWMRWLEYRVTDEAAAFSFAYVVTPIDAWDGGATDPTCTYPGSYTCTYHGEFVYYMAGQVINGIHPFVPGSNALPNDTGHVQAIFEAIKKNIPGTLHVEFQEQAGAGSSTASNTEARTAWCFSESDLQVGVTDVEWYTGTFTKKYVGPNEFASWQLQTASPGSDSSVCAGL